MEPNLRSLDRSSHNLSAHLLSPAHNLSLLSSTARPEMADNEARDMADQPPASGDDEAREFHELDSKHCSQESNRSTNDSFQPMNNLTVLAALDLWPSQVEKRQVRQVKTLSKMISPFIPVIVRGYNTRPVR